MEYRKFGSKLIVRLDPGEEIVEQVLALAEREQIQLAHISALGAVDHFVVGVYRVDEKVYLSNEFRGAYEIVSLTGTLSTMDGKPYLHLHMSAGDEKGQVVGGHLNKAYISATCEMVIDCIPGSVGRCRDEKTGLNIFKF